MFNKIFYFFKKYKWSPLFYLKKSFDPPFWSKRKYLIPQFPGAPPGKKWHFPKLFWKTIRPFLSNKGTHDNHNIILEDNGDLIKDNEDISDILNEFYINTVEQITGKKPPILNSASTVSADGEIDIIICKCDDHPSIRKIKQNVSPFSQFSLNYATEDTILRILLSLDISKEAGYDALPPKTIKLAAPIIVTPLTKIINLSISVSKYPDIMKEICISLLFNKEKTIFP